MSSAVHIDKLRAGGIVRGKIARGEYVQEEMSSWGGWGKLDGKIIFHCEEQTPRPL